MKLVRLQWHGMKFSHKMVQYSTSLPFRAILAFWSHNPYSGGWAAWVSPFVCCETIGIRSHVNSFWVWLKNVSILKSWLWFLFSSARQRQFIVTKKFLQLHQSWKMFYWIIFVSWSWDTIFVPFHFHNNSMITLKKLQFMHFCFSNNFSNTIKTNSLINMHYHYKKIYTINQSKIIISIRNHISIKANNFFIQEIIRNWMIM